MNSTGAKYEKFTTKNEREYDKLRKSSCTTKCLVLVVLIIVAAATIVAVSVAIGIRIGIAIGDHDNEEECKTGLNAITVTQGELEGEYYGSNGGIRFQAIVNSTYFTLTITTITGEHVAFIIHPIELNMTMMGVNNTNFMIMENQPGRPKYDDYIVPEAAMNMIMSMMMGEMKMSDEMLKQLDNTTVNETRKHVLYTLAMSDEAILIIEAAQALGSLGVEGSQYPAAMRFYQFALQLAKAKESTEEESRLRLRNTKSITKRSRKRSVLCCSNGATCASDACPTGDECFGMCGKGCWCWSFVCGDCCVHEYCRSHDQCCDEHGFFSSACFSIAWNILISECTDTYVC